MPSSLQGPPITAQQSRMARAGLGWSLEDLAERSGISKPTIQRFEAGQNVKVDTVETIIQAFVDARVRFDTRGNWGAVYIAYSSVGADALPQIGSNDAPNE